jgi:hypothetical protein
MTLFSFIYILKLDYLKIPSNPLIYILFRCYSKNEKLVYLEEEPYNFGYPLISPMDSNF